MQQRLSNFLSYANTQNWENVNIKLKPDGLCVGNDQTYVYFRPYGLCSYINGQETDRYSCSTSVEECWDLVASVISNPPIDINLYFNDVLVARYNMA